MTGKKEKVYTNKVISWMENNAIVSALRKGLMLITPLLLIGSFCLVLINLPLPGYREFITSVCGGSLYAILIWMYNASMNIVALAAIIGISYSYGGNNDQAHWGYYPIISICCYLIFAVDDPREANLDIFNSMWLFTALFVTVVCCLLLHKMFRLSHKKSRKGIHTWGDADFYNMTASITPILAVCSAFVILKLIVYAVCEDNFQNTATYLIEKMFNQLGSGVLGSFLFIFLIHVVWFFGIHGSNLLGNVSLYIFEAGMIANMQQVANGGQATQVFTKTFFDSFVLMGGSGATLCLLIAMLISSKQKANKKLVGLSIIPSIFNINEYVLFGLPVVFNPIMVIPFTIVPLVLMIISGFAVSVGLVPVPYTQVHWTTPILFSGYLCTGSIAGVILQLVNLVVGTLIYIPFIHWMENYHVQVLKDNMEGIKNEMIMAEESGQTVNLMKGPRNKQDIIKMLIRGLRNAVEDESFELHYQPQMQYNGRIHGIEALLRFEYKPIGYLYPPLVLELAKMDNILDDMGLKIIDKAAGVLEKLNKEEGYTGSMSVNISPLQFENIHFCDRVKDIVHKYDWGECTLCFEITERVALSHSELVMDRIERLKEEGIAFHMDDFGMGHSSMTYMQNYNFEVVKLDGSLVKTLLKNERSNKIIQGIQQMSETLGFELIAEFVETEEQKELLHKLGCNIYQGYLYSKAIPITELMQFVKKYQ